MSFRGPLNDLQNGWGTLVTELGTEFVLRRKDDTLDKLIGHVVPNSKEDANLINSVGIDAVLIHCLPIPEPKKYDTITSPASGRRYTVQAVHEVVLKSKLLGYKVVAR